MASRCTARLPSPPRVAARSGRAVSLVSVRPVKSGVARGRAVVCAVSFRPCIDIHKGKVKQIVGSTLRDSSNDGTPLVTNFESDKPPAEFANLYKEDELVGGHVIMLGADPASQAAAMEALHAYPGGLQVGGGINLENAISYLNEGASHVIVTSYVFSEGKMNIERLKQLVNLVGKHRLVLDLSCRKKDGRYAIVTDRWQKFSDVFVDEPTLKHLAAYADEFLVHGVDVEGKRLGIDEELVELLGRYSPIPVTYAGGVSTMDDLERIKRAGKSRVDVTVGSALDIFGGDLHYKDVVLWHKDQNMREQTTPVQMRNNRPAMVMILDSARKGSKGAAADVLRPVAVEYTRRTVGHYGMQFVSDARTVHCKPYPCGITQANHDAGGIDTSKANRKSYQLVPDRWAQHGSICCCMAFTSRAAAGDTEEKRESCAAIDKLTKPGKFNYLPRLRLHTL
uniref:1-(5-phosphoribosyl)-5-[(5-phosphoribosylamino)methylideneamino] imidazole-4-carboxamide isomerase HISN3, chloroplastic n=1 Tax=Oryza brachyantha TaxID=4533 RepID=J3M6Z2_ORYBR